MQIALYLNHPYQRPRLARADEMAKLTRESRLRERRLEKQARKQARKQAAAHPPTQPNDPVGRPDHSFGG